MHPSKNFQRCNLYVIIFASQFLDVLCYLNFLKALEIRVFHISTLKYHCIHLRVALFVGTHKWIQLHDRNFKCTPL
nr:MAG TPA: hypothetical protein [Caudoviricetes sp.]